MLSNYLLKCCRTILWNALEQFGEMLSNYLLKYCWTILWNALEQFCEMLSNNFVKRCRTILRNAVEQFCETLSNNFAKRCRTILRNAVEHFCGMLISANNFAAANVWYYTHTSIGGDRRLRFGAKFRFGWIEIFSKENLCPLLRHFFPIKSIPDDSSR
jgi:hypothetical protein